MKILHKDFCDSFSIEYVFKVNRSIILALVLLVVVPDFYCSITFSLQDSNIVHESQFNHFLHTNILHQLPT